MKDEEFLVLLKLMMVSDPWPVEPEFTYDIFSDLMDRESEKRGFEDWIDAYHNFKIKTEKENA